MSRLSFIAPRSARSGAERPSLSHANVYLPVVQRALASVSVLALGVALTAVADGGRSAMAAEYLAGSTTIQGTDVAGNTATGGMGSGGGAGLGGAVFVGTGASVTLDSVHVYDNTAVGGLGGVGSAGGTMNNDGAGGSPGTSGQNGKDAEDGAIINGGNGLQGQNGFAGSAGPLGQGGNGGNGGNGSDGLADAETLQTIKDVAESAIATYRASLGDPTMTGLYTALATAMGEGAVAATADPLAPNPALAAALTEAATQFGELAAEAGADDVLEVTDDAAQAAYVLAVTTTADDLGVSGNGGLGGIGGAGGRGSFGQGGGAGGKGGDGGDAISLSGAIGGLGGAGGDGGTGGFGAGGGKGGDGGLDGASGDESQNGEIGGLSGNGGRAGFGAGAGSDGDGTANGVDGGGGSGYGGAVFVEAGGTLTITGNTTFDHNNVEGGSSANGGAAGQAAGQDLFMMTGSTVNLDPGAGNTIIFDDSIADDSAASIAGASIAAGQGAGINIESGLVEFNGEDTYSGVTKISGGVLQAQDGWGINQRSNIDLAGGVLQSHGTFDRFVGTNPTDVQWTGSGGFAAAGGDLTVDLSEGARLTWGSNSFVPDGSDLLFGSDSADSNVHFENAIGLDAGNHTIINNGGADGSNLAFLDGSISGIGGLVLGDGSTLGTIITTAINNYQGATDVKSGTRLVLNGAGSIADSSVVTVDGTLDAAHANGGTSLTSLAGSGSVDMGQQDLTLTDGTTEFAGGIHGGGDVTIAGGTQTFSGANTYTGQTTVDSGAQLSLKDNGDISQSLGLLVQGEFDIASATAEVSVKTVSGLGTVNLGAKLLALTGASGSFSGAIEGIGGSLDIASGSETLSGSNTYTGETEVDSGASLALTGSGSIASSDGLLLDGTFDISGTTSGAVVATLQGDGSVALGAQTLVVTNGSTIFSGSIDGTGYFDVAGGTQQLAGATVNTGLMASNGGAIETYGLDTVGDGIRNTTVTANAGQAALTIANGGSITTADTTLQSTDGPTAAASFDESGKTASFELASGTTIAGNNGVLLQVSRSGAGSDGIVNFQIDSGVTANGDILDEDPTSGVGTTNVTMQQDSSWTGLAEVGNFNVAAGAIANFAEGSHIYGTLSADAGAIVSGGTLADPLNVTGEGATDVNTILSGDINFSGDINLGGELSPGNSPGIITTAGDLNASGSASSLFQVVFGSNDPEAGIDYDQTDVAQNLTGTLPVQLAAWTIGGGPIDRSTPLGDLSKVELLRVGGDVTGNVAQVGRLTQNGHEVVLDETTRDADPTAMVGTTGDDEVTFFGAGPITTYGLTDFVQDETYGLATLTGTLHRATDDMLGTYADRMQASLTQGGKPIWMRVGGGQTSITDTVSQTQDLGFSQFGVDLYQANGFRVGLLGAYGNSHSGVQTHTGTDGLSGNIVTAGVDANWTNGAAYVDATGEYGWSDWTFSPTSASALTVSGGTATASLETGYGIGVGGITVTPWTQLTYQTTSYGKVQSDWVDNVDFTDRASLEGKAGVRAEGALGGVKPYAQLSLAHDFLEDKTVDVDGFDFATGSGGTAVQLGGGVQAVVGNGLNLQADVNGTYGLGGDVTGYQGTAGLHGHW